MPPCALTTLPTGSSERRASIAAGVAPSGPEARRADNAVAAGRGCHAGGQTPGRGLEVARLDHGSHDDVPSGGGRAARGGHGGRQLVACRREVAVGEQRQGGHDVERVGALGNRLGAGRSRRLGALGTKGQTDRGHDAHGPAPQPGARHPDQRGQYHERGARELLRAVGELLDLGGERDRAHDRRLERARELVDCAAHSP